MKKLLAMLLLAALPLTAIGQSITPGKYKTEKLSQVHRAAFDFDGSGLGVTENRDGTISLIMQYRWSVANGRLIQSEIRYTKNRLKWFVTEDTSVPIRSISPASFELQTTNGWVKWDREQ